MALGDDGAFERLWREGRAMKVTEAVECVSVVPPA
jgi:hypothetical protein